MGAGRVSPCTHTGGPRIGGELTSKAVVCDFMLAREREKHPGPGPSAGVHEPVPEAEPGGNLVFGRSLHRPGMMVCGA